MIGPKAARVACAVFVKTPGQSPVKTRLAATLGQPFATEFYKRSCDALEELLLKVQELTPGFEPYWAVAEVSAQDAECWSSLPRVSQGEGGLGARLHGVYDSLLATHEAVMLLGADSPFLSIDDITQGVLALKYAPFALGRADDGGFYLFSGRARIPEFVWLNVPYSVESTAQVLHESLLQHGEITELAARSDIDTEADLRRVLSCTDEEGLLPKQRELLAWLKHPGRL
jgi:glycosyltransferase A (GT-A) superfamily protein (DUF2064 family)